MSTTKLDLEAILARCRAATAGPWYVVGPPWRARWFDKSIQMHRDVPTYVVAGREDPHVGKPVCEAPDIEEWPSDDADVPPEQTYEGMVEQGDADLEFIAHARTDVPLLVQEIERLRRALAHDKPQPDYCDCDGFCTGLCADREIERVRAALDDANTRFHELSTPTQREIELRWDLQECRRLLLEASDKLLHDTDWVYTPCCQDWCRQAEAAGGE